MPKPFNEEKKIRPKTLQNYIGNENIKKQIRVLIVSAIKRKSSIPHIIMSGPPGLGKTTIAGIIANEMKVPFISLMATSIDKSETVEELLAKIPDKGYNKKTGVLENPEEAIFPIVFIDEIHRLKKSITELFHTILEDFTVTLKKKSSDGSSTQAVKFWVPKFTMIGATNYLGLLPKPFIDRFHVNLAFETYDDENLFKIVQASSSGLDIEITEEAIWNIAEKSRGVPRLANQNLLRCRDVAIALEDKFQGVVNEECVKYCFELQEIDENGLSKLDRKVLRYIAKAKRPVGVEPISQAVDEDSKTIESYIEPWLVQKGLIIKTKGGRVITEEGLKHLGKNEIEEEFKLHKLEEEYE